MLRKIAANTWIWTDNFAAYHSALIKKVSKLGFDGIEIPIPNKRFNIAESRQSLLESRRKLVPIVLVGGTPNEDISSGIAEIRERGEKRIQRSIEICKLLGGNLVGGPMYVSTGNPASHSRINRTEMISRSVESMKRLANFAATKKIKIAIEPICRYDNSLLNTVQQAKSFVSKVGRGNVGLLLDTFHLNIEEKSIKSAILDAGSRLFHFHACENDRGVLGTGHIDWDEIADALDEIEYDGWLSIESFNPKDVTLATRMKLWRSMAKNQDELARRGLEFLRRKLV
ncbi:MAG: sugar phosphate isomerase/epimerase [Thaumarchaeota archaeon]|nr:sugar phosphate isomerase/epimerase [Nitrososphaerota archaeon]